MSCASQIPIIDLSGPESTVSRLLVSAAEDHGFIYIKNLGFDISLHQINEVFQLSAKLFDSPLADKQRCAIQTNNRGWSAMHTETLDPANQKVGDFKEAFNFGQFVNGKAQQPLPQSVASSEPQISAFTDSCHALCQKILYLLGLGLGVGDFFSSAHDKTRGPSASIVRFLRYPPADTTVHAANDVRAGAHSDYGSITLLFRLKGQAGLEILNKHNAWVPVPVCPSGTEHDPSPPILINIGDLLSYWTNGLFRSTVHRVVFPTSGSASVAGETSMGVRYSIAYFCHPIGAARLEAVPSERVKNHVTTVSSTDANRFAQKEVHTADEHLFMRLKATYGKLYADKEAT